MLLLNQLVQRHALTHLMPVMMEFANVLRATRLSAFPYNWQIEICRLKIMFQHIGRGSTRIEAACSSDVMQTKASSCLEHAAAVACCCCDSKEIGFMLVFLPSV